MTLPSAFLIGGTASGSGKTTLTLGIMAAFKARGLLVQPFKCGPDFIDPSLHRMVTGEISSNLDLRMCGKEFCNDIFHKRFADKDVAVVEGVMGLFDGGNASSAALAEELRLPVVLVVDARSAAESVAAVVKGFEVYSPAVAIAGVIFNRVGSPRHRELIEKGMVGICSCKILGFFPRDIRFEIPDRHLGLHMGEEKPLDDLQIAQLVQAVEKNIDLDLLLEISLRPPPSQGKIGTVSPKKTKKFRLAVARDKAFCFYYEDNFELLAASGVELVFFSPLSDSSLPEGCQGIYFGGGYPELYAGVLSDNDQMLTSVREFGHSGGIILGECGGFMYLCDQITTNDKEAHNMTGLFPLKVLMKERFSRLGYRRPKLTKDCFLGKTGQELHGHEFHYSGLVDIPKNVATLYQLSDNTQEGYTYKNVIGSYVHLHFARSAFNIQSFIHHLEQSKVST